ncbi:MAG: hypothetical protein RID91_13445 [Azospirillaceae bacterium]
MVVTEWRLHLGAHKTATTHIQKVLARLQETGPRRGFQYVPPEVTRRLDRTVFRRRHLFRDPRYWMGPEGRAASIEAIFAGHLDDRPIVVLSEENWLGGSVTDILAETPYPEAGHRLDYLRHLARRSRLSLFIGLRSFDTLLPSAYAQALREGPLGVTFEDVRASAARRPPSWLAPIERIRRLVPDTPITLWRYEDYRAHAHGILEAICGEPIEAVPMIADPAETRSASPRALARIEALPRGLAGEAYRARAEAIIAEHAVEPERFAPLTEVERERLRARYEADLAALRSMSGVRVLEVPVTAA